MHDEHALDFDQAIGTETMSTPRHKPGTSTAPLVVTIDGPAGAGKSTVAKLLAKALGFAYLDTGATYRALAYNALEQDMVITDVDRLVALARRLPLTLASGADGELRVELDGADITRAIRTEEVSEAAAYVSQYPGVRAAMVRRQRELARGAGVVVEGRDTGSVVFPGAPYKFFLSASPLIRARRRQAEMSCRYGSRTPLKQIQELLHFRDGLDRTRRVGALVKPPGAVTIDTSRRSATQVVQTMLRHIRSGPRVPTKP